MGIRNGNNHWVSTFSKLSDRLPKNELTIFYGILFYYVCEVTDYFNGMIMPEVILWKSMIYHINWNTSPVSGSTRQSFSRFCLRMMVTPYFLMELFCISYTMLSE